MMHPPSRPLLASSLALAFFAAACGRPAVEPANDPGLPHPSAIAPPPGPVAPKGHVLRAEVDHALVKLGPGWLLRRVMAEEVLKKDGKFLGWRMTGLPEEWSAIDLRPGDVVTKINGLGLETPDAAWNAWKSTATRGDIEISLMRDGTARKVTIPIDGPPSPATAQALERPSAPPTGRAPAAPRSGIQIGGRGSEPVEDESF